MLQAGVMTVGAVFAVATLLADLLYAMPQSAHPLRGERNERRLSEPPSSAKSMPAHEFGATLAACRSATFLIGLLIVLFWVGCAIFGRALVPYDPYRRRSC